MRKSLFKGLTEQEQLDVKASFKGSLIYRKRLTEVLQSKIDVAFTAMRNKAEYEDPSWAYKQADSLGYVRGINELINLLNEK